MWVPGSAVSSSFENFPISVGRTLLPRNSAIVIAVIVDFACCESLVVGLHVSMREESAICPCAKPKQADRNDTGR